METKTNKHGPLTAEIGQILSKVLQGKYEVFYDHGDPSKNKNVGKIVSAIEKDFNRGDELSQLDIAIVKKSSNNKVSALIEIEETTDNPKTFLGDIFGLLMGNYILFGKKHDLFLVDEQTNLFVVGINKVDHKKHNDHIIEQVSHIKSKLSTNNAKTGKITIKTFSDDKNLLEKFPPMLYEALKENEMDVSARFGGF